MTSVRIGAQNGILLRSNSITLIRNAPDGLYAGTISGQKVRITESARAYKCQLALLDEMHRAEAEDRYSILVRADDTEKDTWKYRYVELELD